MRCTFVPALLGLLLVACRSAPASPPVPRYLVTSAPIDVGVHSRGLCVAVDPTDSHGIWWWEPGRTGCSSRSTGPGVFRADAATVAARAATIDVRFHLPLIVSPGSTMPSFADVRLALQDGGMQSLASGARVLTERRHDLEVPEQP